MSNGGSGDIRPSRNQQSKNQRREEARDKARALREQHRKRERRNKYLLQGGLIVAALAIVAVVTVVITSSIRPPAPGPLNMLSDGIVIGTGFEAETTPALQAGEDPIDSTPVEGSTAIPIQIWLDYQCPICGDFEAANAEQISTLVEEGIATVEIHPVAILDRASQGTRYSTRSANAAACVANYAPNDFFDFSALLLAGQPEENTEGLTDDDLIGIAEAAGVSSASSVEDCITDIRFENWVADATDRATSDEALLNPADNSFGTPTVFVGGARYTGAPDDATEFAKFVAAADGAAFQESTASPSPSPSATPTPAG
ncbi:MAG: hypothetical protein RI885_657 [Actinomycetota bacterium]|jgi:protein-disulfide isomerase